MNEELLYFIWQFRLYSPDLKTTEGEDLIVLNPGMRNPYSGPDFTNCNMKIGTTQWVGNVEIHSKSSDWNKHNHHLDKSYDNIILHVVYEHDVDIKEHIFNHTPTLVLKGKLSNGILDRFNEFQKKNSFIPCEREISRVPQYVIDSFESRLLIERLELKSNEIKLDLEETQSDWEEVFYRTLMRAFGFKANKEAMNQLSRRVPLKVLWKHKHNELEFNALLFGTSGLLESGHDEFSMDILNTFKGLSKKYRIEPLSNSLWKRGGVRPANFPELRLAQLIAILRNSPNQLFGHLIKKFSLAEMIEMFDHGINKYWNEHYSFGKVVSKNTHKKFSKHSTENVVINAIIPLSFLYFKSIGQIDKSEQVIDIFYSLKPESNGLIKKWKDLNVPVKSAGSSQALIHLKNNYCSYKKCLLCSIGGYLIKNDR